MLMFVDTVQKEFTGEKALKQGVRFMGKTIPGLDALNLDIAARRLGLKKLKSKLGSGKALERRGYPPGQHGPKSRRKVSEYAVGLNEKQKLRYIYGLLERQFRRVFEIAKRERGVTGEHFLQLLETRLDSTVYLLGLAKTRSAARQMVNHGHIRVNGHKVDIPSYRVSEHDIVEVRAKSVEMTPFVVARAEAARWTYAGRAEAFFDDDGQLRDQPVRRRTRAGHRARAIRRFRSRRRSASCCRPTACSRCS